MWLIAHPNPGAWTRFPAPSRLHVTGLHAPIPSSSPHPTSLFMHDSIYREFGLGSIHSCWIHNIKKRPSGQAVELEPTTDDGLILLRNIMRLDEERVSRVSLIISSDLSIMKSIIICSVMGDTVLTEQGCRPVSHSWSVFSFL